MGILAEFNANEELRRRIYVMTNARWGEYRKLISQGRPPTMSYGKTPLFSVTPEDLDLWKRSMDLERALWAIFNLESAVLRDLMRILNDFHEEHLGDGLIKHISWSGNKAIRFVYEKKICAEKDVRLDLSDLPTEPESLRLYWNVRHQWVHRHGLIDDTFRRPEKCEKLFAEGWFQFDDGRAWLREDDMREILLSCVDVGRHILGQAMEKYPTIRAKLE